MTNFYLYNQKVCTRLYLFGHDLRQLLLANNWQESELAQADYIFINSCSFLKTTEDYFITKIKELDQQKSAQQKIVVFGCLPHTALERLQQNFSGEIITTRELSALAMALGLEQVATNIGYTVPRQLRFRDRINKLLNTYLIKDAYLGFLSGELAYYLNISRGCLGNCSYCSEKTARGKLKSHSISDIKIAFESGLRQHFRLFSLNADDVGVFGWDNQENIAILLTELLSFSENFKLILTEFNPWGLAKYRTELLPLLTSTKIAHITIPLQSGSDRILKLMDRPYSASDILAIIKTIKSKHPTLVINTHLIVGFPGEQAEDFQTTLKLIESGLFDKVKIFKYSDHEKVASYLLPDKVPLPIIDSRFRQLRSAILKQSLRRLNLRNILLNLPLYLK